MRFRQSVWRGTYGRIGQNLDSGSLVGGFGASSFGALLDKLLSALHAVSAGK